MASIEQNTALPIYNADGTRFHDLELKKVVVDSVVMSLSDKITGEVCYKDNTLGFTMQEYVKYRRNEDEDYTKYFLVNPPTIVREGLVKDNSDLNGMTKYSFEFYHPMYILGNLPFSDVAVSNNEKKHLSQNKTFSWIRKPQDYINKINKNLEGTEWIVVKSDRFPQEKDDELSDVLSFDNNTIADALKTGYETWGLPYVVSQINIGEPYYSQGKRFKVEFGLPNNEILVDNEPYIFQFGQGVGLKNNSRTPRNNKIITRIAGYGSENNIPYGYPQIRWYGDQSATETPAGYPIYDGIVGGVVRKLIKHPFTRTHLMPSIYTQTVFNKVSPYLANGSANPDYNPDEEIVDYYDAVYSVEYPYINEINLLAPSYEIHGFDDIKPELDSDRQLGIVSAIPLNQDLTPASQWDDTYDAEKDEYVQSYFKITLPQLSFDLYACASIMEEMQVNMRSGACLGCTFPIQVDWEDYKRNFYDADGNFLPNGSQRDLTKYPKSNLGQIDIIVQKETQTFGTLMPNIYQQPTANDLFVILGISMPVEYITDAEERLDDVMKSYMLENNVYYYDYPLKFDEHFLATHTNILSQIRPNSIIRFGFKGYSTPLELFVKQLTVKYGEGVLPQYDITLTDNIEVVLNQIGKVADDVEKLGSLVAILRQTYNRNIWSELDKKLSKVKDDSTPHKLGMGEMQVDGDGAIGSDLSVGGDLSVAGDTQHVGDMTFGSKNPNDETSYSQNVKGCKIYWNGSGWSIETDYLAVNKKMYAKSIQVNEVTHVGGENLLTDAACVADIVKTYSTFYRVFFRKKNGEGRTIFNSFRQGDQAYCQIFNIDAGLTHDFTNRYYWRMVVNTSNDTGTYDAETRALMEDYHFIDLSIDIADASGDIRMDNAATSIPLPEDPIIQLGYRPSYDHSANPLTGDDILERQGATLISGGGKWKRSIVMWEEIKTFHLPEPKIKISPNEVNLVVDSLKIRTSGSGGSSQDQPIEDFVDETQSQFLIFETETTAIPTLSNAPYTSWSAAEKELYSTEPNNAVVLNADGRTWRFVKSGNTYAFEEFTDPWLLAQHVKIEQILEDDVITANEIPQMQLTCNEIIAQYTKANTEYTGMPSPRGQDIVSIFDSLTNYYNILCSDETGNTGYFYDFSLMTPPIFLKSGSEPNRYRASRSDILQAIYNFNLKLEEWNKAYASSRAHAEVLNVISNLTQYTIDQSLRDLLDDYADLVENGTHSTLVALDTGIKAVTEWIGDDAMGSTGMTTYLNTLFVGTGAMSFQKDGNNVIYFDTVGRRIYQDSNGLYWLDDTTTPATKHYYKTTDPSADGKTPKEYGKPHIENISKSGLVTSERFAALTSRVETAEGNIIAQATIATWVEEAFDDSDNAATLKSHILITADDVKIESGGKDFGDYFSLMNGNLWCQNLTVEGVYNNLIDVIDWSNNKGRDKIIAVYFSSNDEVLAYTDKNGNLVDPNNQMANVLYVKCYLDVANCGDVVVIKSLPPILKDGELCDGMLYLPYYIDHNTQERTYTRFNDSGIHLITPDELRMMTGKKMVIRSTITDTTYRETFITGPMELTPLDSTGSPALLNLVQGQPYFLKRSGQQDTVLRDQRIGEPKTLFIDFKLCLFFNSTAAGDIHGYGFAWTGTTTSSPSEVESIDSDWTTNNS